MSKAWVQNLKQVMKSHTGSNVITGFLMVLIEKLVEMDFACPCDPKTNLAFSLAYFLVPALFSSTLMFYIHSPECKSKCLLSTITCIIPAGTWVLLLFFDGQYFACARTSWEGLTVHTDISASTTWCEPFMKYGNITAKQREFFGFRNISQVVALSLLLVISGVLFIIGGIRCTRGKKEPKAERVEMEEAGQSSSSPPERSSLMEGAQTQRL
ncbi:uncharacterized protein LOC122323460 [Puntigrus tetrazona]|uniref:uncharacterized protein LOC122323460 n=1 Tax=Puntigrus tetrazona TaxID=1606681 RepID=UPI001C8A3AC4|nr:uncharacterized protein LOC122323460 [Puntigrus tetrazona]